MRKSVTGALETARFRRPGCPWPVAVGFGRAPCASAACSVTGFKLNACFPSGSLARACAKQRGYPVTPLLGHTERGLWTRHLVSTLPRCLSFVGCGQCPFSVINHSHENNHMLSPRESANLG